MLHDFIVPVSGSGSKIRNSAAGVREAGDAPALQLLPLSRQQPLQREDDFRQK